MRPMSHYAAASSGGRLSRPHRGLLGALGHPLALKEHDAQVEVPCGMPLVGRLSKPYRGLLGALRNPLPLVVHEAKVGMFVGISLIGRLLIPNRGLLVALGNPSSLLVVSLLATLALSCVPWATPG